MRRPLFATLALVLALAAPAAAQGPDLASHVDPMIGTGPPGFVVPGAAVPFGMVQNSPDTRGEFAYSGYLYTDPQIQGFSLVHISGPGVRKGGDIPLMPTVGPVTAQDPSIAPTVFGSPFAHATEVAEPGYYRTHLAKYATDVELTASERTGMQRYTFPPSPQSNVIFDVARSAEGLHSGQIRFSGKDEVSGYAEGRYRVHFVAKFSRPFASTGTFKADGEGAGGWATFDTTSERTVTVRVGISFVDGAGARRNLEAEAPDFDFDRMRARARAAWNRELGRVRVSGGTDLDRTTFYTALYHSLLHPNVFNDVDGRYMGFDKKPHRVEGRTQYANFSSWDLYKGFNQLLATIHPRRYRDMLLTLLQNYREWGRIPRWGEHYFDANHMSGDPAVPMITDGVCRGGILTKGEAEELLDASEALVARREETLERLGYLPDRAGTTLEYGIADFALALLADSVGRRDDGDRFERDSLRYRNILDPETRWIRPRGADGSWQEPFDPTEDRGFQEGNSWQYSWLAPHDARGLYDRMGGDAAAAERLDQYFSMPPEAANQATFFGIVYRTPWHAPGNEHDLQVPWMYPFAGQPWKTMSEHREIQRIFRPEPNGLPGNDDLGGLSSWLAWSMLGIGPVTPGAPFYVIGSPTFERAVLTPDGGRQFAIEAPGASPLNQYVTAATVGGRQLGGAWLYDASLRRGETLRLTTGAQPNEAFGSAPVVRPPSVSDSRRERFGCLPTPSSPAGQTPPPGAAERPPTFDDPSLAPLEPGPVRADGTAPPQLVRLRLRVAPGVAVSGKRTVYRLTVQAKRNGRWVPVRGARVRLAGVRARTGKRGVAKIRAAIRRDGVHRANATAAAARPAFASVRVRRAR